jgi:CUG-BP- and ETR3-like factor
MSSHEEAVLAIDSLDSKYLWEGMNSTMVVKWMDQELQKKRREEHMAAVRHGMATIQMLPGSYCSLGMPTGTL